MRSSIEARRAAFVYAAEEMAVIAHQDSRTRLVSDLARAARVLLSTPDSEAALDGCLRLLISEALALADAAPERRNAALEVVSAALALTSPRQHPPDQRHSQ
jgi:hypothetical protein